MKRKINGKEVEVDITTVKGQEKAPDHKIPYFQKLNKGLSVGLYKPGTGTRSWIARFRHEGKYRTETLDTAKVQTYTEAVAAASAWQKKVLEADTRRTTRLSRLKGTRSIAGKLPTDCRTNASQKGWQTGGDEQHRTKGYWRRR